MDQGECYLEQEQIKNSQWTKSNTCQDNIRAGADAEF
jgi:hypothetical protein